MADTKEPKDHCQTKETNESREPRFVTVSQHLGAISPAVLGNRNRAKWEIDWCRKREELRG